MGCVLGMAGPTGLGQPMRLATFILIVAAFFLSRPADAAELNVVIDNLRSAKGAIFLALWNSAEGFTDSQAALINTNMPASLGQVSFDLGDLPAGAYAIATFHDENGNGEFDTTWLGLPDEGLGFSNGAWIGLGAPSFKEAAFDLTAERDGSKVHIVRVGIRYPGDRAKAEEMPGLKLSE
jgi:uncharacterized protein (DUF2141 family)